LKIFNARDFNKQYHNNFLRLEESLNLFKIIVQNAPSELPGFYRFMAINFK